MSHHRLPPPPPPPPPFMLLPRPPPSGEPPFIKRDHGRGGGRRATTEPTPPANRKTVNARDSVALAHFHTASRLLYLFNYSFTYFCRTGPVSATWLASQPRSLSAKDSLIKASVCVCRQDACVYLLKHFDWTLAPPSQDLRYKWLPVSRPQAPPTVSFTPLEQDGPSGE